MRNVPRSSQKFNSARGFLPIARRTAIRRLKKLPHLKTISISYTIGADDFLNDIHGMTSLEELSFYRARVSAAGAHHLTSFLNLKRLFLYDGVDPVALDVLKDHPGIEKLYFSGCLTPKQIAVLKTLPNLRDLTLHVELQDCGALDLRGLPKLERLDLGGLAATDVSLAGIGDMTHLTELILCDSFVTDAGLVHLRTNRNLKRLNLSGQPATDTGVEEFRQMRLSGRRITDAGLAQLANLTALETLNLSKTQVTDQGVKNFQQVLPHCKIDR